MDFITRFLIFINWKDKIDDSILVIIDQLIKIVYYQPVKVIINTLAQGKVIIEMIVQHHDLPNSNVNDQGSIFDSKFWSSICYFLGIK